MLPVKFVRRLEVLPARHLSPLVALPPLGEAVQTGHWPLTQLPLATLASVEVTEDIENGLRQFTTKVTAALRCHYEVPTVPVALVLTLTDGSQLIVGTASRPFPVVTVTVTRPDKASSQSCETLTATWTAPTPALSPIAQ